MQCFKFVKGTNVVNANWLIQIRNTDKVSDKVSDKAEKVIFEEVVISVWTEVKQKDCSGFLQ